MKAQDTFVLSYTDQRKRLKMNHLLLNVTLMLYFRILPSKHHFLILVLSYWMESLSFVKSNTRNSRGPDRGTFKG